MLDFFRKTTPETAATEAGTSTATSDVAPEVVELRVQVEQLRGLTARALELLQRATGAGNPDLSAEVRELHAATDASAFYGAEEQP